MTKPKYMFCIFPVPFLFVGIHVFVYTFRVAHTKRKERPHAENYELP